MPQRNANFGIGTLAYGNSSYTPSHARELMEIIPVIDLLDGAVVRARQGERARYRPIETPLSPTSDPIDVARGLLSLHPFATIYVADLDAIAGKPDNRHALVRLRAAFAHVTFWVDNGIATLSAAEAWLDERLGDLVLGSETQADAELVRRFADDERIALSLDFRAQAFLGPPELLDDPSCWPQRVIAMTLARVGSGAGPDLERLTAIQEAASGREVYAAGGVRHAGDLANLARSGVAGVLVASCLHDGCLNGEDLGAF